MYVISEDDVATIRYLAENSVMLSLTDQLLSCSNEELANLEFTNYINIAASSKHCLNQLTRILADIEKFDPPKKTLMQKLRIKK